VRPGRNLAGEERDEAVVDGVAPSAFAPLPSTYRHELTAALAAAARAVQMAAAAAQALALVRRHVGERIQFGRPLSHLQAVQHQVAMLASSSAAMQVASDAAVLALRDGSPSAPVLTAAAKIETSTLARTVASIAHQLHGALGLTREHHLASCTLRLWSWREEYGNELVWQEQLAGIIDAAGGDVWGVLTNVFPERSAARS
jgi:acyl-CoA dehydrogenase